MLCTLEGTSPFREGTVPGCFQTLPALCLVAQFSVLTNSETDFQLAFLVNEGDFNQLPTFTVVM